MCRQNRRENIIRGWNTDCKSSLLLPPKGRDWHWRENNGQLVGYTFVSDSSKGVVKFVGKKDDCYRNCNASSDPPTDKLILRTCNGSNARE